MWFNAHHLLQSTLTLLGAFPCCHSSLGQKPGSSFAMTSTMLRAFTAIFDASLFSLPYSSSCVAGIGVLQHA